MSEKSNKPKDTAFRQQRLKAFKPVHTAKSSALIFLGSSLVFFTFGILLYVECNNQKEHWTTYDHCKIDEPCTIKLEISSTMQHPVYVYYQLTNFYQNHRLYVKSKSYTQLRGDKPSSTELENCKGARYNKDFAGYYKGKTLNADSTARPCGLIARSVFNDTFAIEGYDIDTDDITTETDRKMFKSVDKNKEWTDMDEKFINWMKIAPLPTFRKLYGAIRKDVESGEITINVGNHYDVGEWDGEKAIVLSTSGMFGGKNIVLGVVFITAGVFCFVCSLVFTSAALFCKQKWLEQDPRLWKF